MTVREHIEERIIGMVALFGWHILPIFLKAGILPAHFSYPVFRRCYSEALGIPATVGANKPPSVLDCWDFCEELMKRAAPNAILGYLDYEGAIDHAPVTVQDAQLAAEALRQYGFYKCKPKAEEK